MNFMLLSAIQVVEKLTVRCEFYRRGNTRLFRIAITAAARSRENAGLRPGAQKMAETDPGGTRAAVHLAVFAATAAIPGIADSRRKEDIGRKNE